MLFQLNEEIFQREETKEMDREFKKILDWYKSVDVKTVINTDLNEKFETELRNIEKLVKDLMNAKIIFKFDDASNPRNLSYGMMIFPSMQELKGRIRDAIEKHQEGFYLRNCSNVLIAIDLGLLTLLKKYEKNERYLTAVLLHELGHKVYIKSQYEAKDKNESKNYLISSFGITFAVSSIFLSYAIPWIILLATYGATQFYDTKSYVDSEHLSDVTAVKYGYGTETYELMDLFYRLTQKRRNTKIKLFRQLSNVLNPSKMRRDEVEKALKKELNDPKNSRIQKALIKDSLEELKKIKTV